MQVSQWKKKNKEEFPESLSCNLHGLLGSKGLMHTQRPPKAVLAAREKWGCVTVWKKGSKKVKTCVVYGTKKRARALTFEPAFNIRMILPPRIGNKSTSSLLELIVGITAVVLYACVSGDFAILATRLILHDKRGRLSVAEPRCIFRMSSFSIILSALRHSVVTIPALDTNRTMTLVIPSS